MKMRLWNVLCLFLALAISLSLTACGLFGLDGNLSSGVESDVPFSTETGPDSDGFYPAPSDSSSLSSDSVLNSPSTEATEPSSTQTPATQTPSDSQTPSVAPATTDSISLAPSTDTGTPPVSTAPTVSSQPSTQPSSQPTDSVTQNPSTEPEDTPNINTDISPIHPSEYYGRVWLSKQTNGEKLLKTYDEMVAGVGARQDTVSLSAGVSVSEFFTVWNCLHSDYPDYFWLGHSYRYSYNSGGAVTAVKPEYTLSKSEIPGAQAKYKAAIQKFTQGIHSGMTQYEIEKILHDRLILACTYRESSHAHDAYGALVEGVAVCEGISYGFMALCRSVGIEAMIATGTSQNPSTGNPENHAWNIVKIDGDYYHIDVTWDNAGEPEEGGIHYAWFNLPTSWISQDHTLVPDGYTYPDCTSTRENYFTKNGLIFSELSETAVVSHSVRRGDSYVFQAYLQNQQDAQGWFSAHLGNLARAFGLNGCSCTMQFVGKEIIFIIGPYRG